jgi:F-type H+-transporting ATPase subunit a
MNRLKISVITLLLLFANFFASIAASTSNDEKFDPKKVILHHIADNHEWHIASFKNDQGNEVHISLPLPIILLTEGHLDIFMSSAFHQGDKIIDDRTYSIDDHGHIVEAGGMKVLDFSITKNVASLFISMIILFLIFSSVAKAYTKNRNASPKGLQSFMEPLILFVRDDIAIPNIGEKKYKKFLPYLLTVFFLVWVNNLLGLIPIFPGGANVTGNIAFTMVLSLFTLFLTNINANKYYWKHIFMPPVPVALWPIMIPVELIGVISKPFALMIRLYANISAGHIIILSLVSLIFIFKTIAIAPVSIVFVLFMNLVELLVAALQAYIFTLLTALFVGMAVEEHHHEEAHH